MRSDCSSYLAGDTDPPCIHDQADQWSSARPPEW